MGFWDKVKDQVKQDMAKQTDKATAIKNRKQELDEQGIAYCPKCLSISVQPIKQGFGLGKAIVGGALLGPAGLLAGGLGKNNIDMHCIKCGNKYRT